jgi:choline kinase
MSVKTAVVLAAGMGMRLRGVLSDVPKGFLVIDGRSLIERSLDMLLARGMQKIIIATGHLKHHYEELADRYPQVETATNAEYARSGSMYSLYCAREAIRAADSDFLLLESDLIYEMRALDRLLSDPRSDVILLSGATHSGDEVYVETRGDRILAMSKDRTRLSGVGGELVGISRISLSLFRQMQRSAELRFKGDLHLDYEDCLVLAASAHPIYYHKIEDLIWSEIDDENHWRRVRETVLPRLKQVDSAWRTPHTGDKIEIR